MVDREGGIVLTDSGDVGSWVRSGRVWVAGQNGSFLNGLIGSRVELGHGTG